MTDKTAGELYGGLKWLRDVLAERTVSRRLIDGIRPFLSSLIVPAKQIAAA